MWDQVMLHFPHPCLVFLHMFLLLPRSHVPHLPPASQSPPASLDHEVDCGNPAWRPVRRIHNSRVTSVKTFSGLKMLTPTECTGAEFLNNSS